MYADTQVMLGPATVIAVDGDRVQLERGGREAWAQLALATPYRPEPGDIVLAIGDDETYIIGVLQGRGKTVLDAPGDLTIRAGGAIEIEAHDVTVRADRFETVAGVAFERFVRCYRWVTDALHLRAGRTRSVIDGDSTLVAERITEQARGPVKIDGEKIYLG